MSDEQSVSAGSDHAVVFTTDRRGTQTMACWGCGASYVPVPSDPAERARLLEEHEHAEARLAVQAKHEG